MEKRTIRVCEKGDYPIPGKTLDVIKRKVWVEAIGNFNPMFCRYKGKRMLVRSDEGDISDPFRREESYLNSLFIEVA